MRILRIIPLIGVLLFLPASIAAQEVTVDYDHAVSFSQYKTFMWLKEPRIIDPLMRRRVVNEINSALTSKGWQLVTDGADVGVIAHGATREEHTLETFYSGFGGWGWRSWGGGVATTVPETYTVGTLIVDLFDTRARQIVWRGMATETLPTKPEKEAAKLNKAVEKMFKKFPPNE